MAAILLDHWTATLQLQVQATWNQLAIATIPLQPGGHGSAYAVVTIVTVQVAELRRK